MSRLSRTVAVEAGSRKSASGSYASLPDDTVPETEWQKSSGLTKRCANVPEIQGIPIPRMPCVRLDTMLFTLLAVGLSLVPFVKPPGCKVAEAVNCICCAVFWVLSW